MKHTRKVLLPLIIFSIFFSFCVNKSISQVTDKDRNTYRTVTIGTQEWMAENLNVEHYRNGDVIPQVKNWNVWANLRTGAWCYYENNEENGRTYGKLYNLFAVTDPRGLAPEGWHIPNENEWKILIDFLGGELFAGEKLKTTTKWKKCFDIIGTNESGFSALPGGERLGGTFKFLGENSTFWSSDKREGYSGWCLFLENDINGVVSDLGSQESGYSVRCIKGKEKVNGDNAPVPLNLKEIMQSLQYPEEANKKHIEGKVQIKVFIDENGIITELGDISGPDVFYNEVQKKIWDLKFSPAMKDGIPIKCWLTVPFNFSLSKKK